MGRRRKCTRGGRLGSEEDWRRIRLLHFLLNSSSGLLPLFARERRREKSMHSDSIISQGASLRAQGALGGDIPGHGSLHSSSFLPPFPSLPGERIHWNFTTFACFCENTHLCLHQPANGGCRGLRIPPTVGARYGKECAVNNASVKLSCEGAK